LKHFLIIVSVFFTLQSLAQPLQTGKRDYFYTGFLVPFNITGYVFLQHKQGLTPEQINMLTVDDISRIDRSATLNYSLQAARTSDLFLYTSLGAPLFLAFNSAIKPDAGKGGIVYLETISLASAEIALIKALVKRPRPFVYNPRAPEHKKTERDALSSFFSGHTAMTSTAAFFAANTWLRYNEGNQAMIYSAAALIPLSTGYLRYRAGKHFPTDIAAGIIIGAFNVWVTDRLHR
jgi:membrane-associated phospholipid phosphatase